MASEWPPAEGLPTNSELYRYVCLRETPKENHSCEQVVGIREFWDELKIFSIDKNILEGNFDGDVQKHFHERFWELYLAKAFDAVGISLSRKVGQPDFNFERNGIKIHMEAVVCGEPQEQNRVPPPTDDFSSNLSSSFENESMQRLGNAVSSKIEIFKESYKSLIQQEKAHYVIALNGWRALNSHPHDSVWGMSPIHSTTPPPVIVRMLFGMGDQFLSSDSGITGFKRADKTKKGAPIAQFLNLENNEIAGVLYSGADVFQTRRDMLGHDFIFIQNPYAPDISDVFGFAPTWRLDLHSQKVVRMGSKGTPEHGK